MRKRTRQLGRYRVDAEYDPGSLGRRFRSSWQGQGVVVESISIRCDEELFERSLRRIEVMTTVSHDHLVPILDAGLDGDQLFIVTPEPDGIAESTGPIGVAAGHVIADVGRGLAHLHHNGALHRDVQLRHIGWYDGVVKLGGFGLADLRGAGRTEGIGPIGSILTMAPSIVRGAPATSGSDIYSLGASLHLLATGIAVHPVRTESVVDRIRRIGSEAPVLSPSLPTELVPLIRTAISADGIDRPTHGESTNHENPFLQPLLTGGPQ